MHFFVYHQNEIIMERYSNYGGKSSIRFYEIEPMRIRVMFSDGKVYSYSYESAGIDHIEEMKRLARSGSGLNSYIMRNVKRAYE